MKKQTKLLQRRGGAFVLFLFQKAPRKMQARRAPPSSDRQTPKGGVQANFAATPARVQDRGGSSEQSKPARLIVF